MNKLFLSRRATFSLKKIILDALYMGDASSPSEQVIQASIHTGLKSGKVNLVNGVPSTYQSTKLSSGITVLTESVSVPSNVNLGIFINVGSRDETSQNSGANLLLKNTYLKTALNTNQTVNYGISQMSGGQFESDFDRQSTFYRASCLSHDVIDVFSMISDCAFEPKNIVATSVGVYKNEKSHQLDSHLGGNTLFNDQIYSTAFGATGLGNKVYGNKNNVSNLSSYVVQNFQSTHVTPDRIVISATGVQNHQQFVDLVNQKLFFTQLPTKSVSRTASTYLGGQVRNLTESSSVHVALAFQGSTYKSCLPLLIAQQVLGNNRRSGRIQRNILNKHAFIDGAQAFSATFTDNGLFGLKVSGSASHAQQVATVAAKQLSELRNVSQGQVDVAKQTLKARLFLEHTNAAKRLECRTKTLFYAGSADFNYTAELDKVTAAEVQSAVSDALKTPLTLVAQGGQVNRLQSYDNLSKFFQ